MSCFDKFNSIHDKNNCNCADVNFSDDKNDTDDDDSFSDKGERQSVIKMCLKLC